MDNLGENYRDAPPGQRSVQAALDEEYSRLIDHAKALYRQISIFEDPFDRDMVVECCDVGASKQATLSILDRMAAQTGLVKRNRHTRAYRMLEIMRLDGRRRLSRDPDELLAIETKRCEYFLRRYNPYLSAGFVIPTDEASRHSNDLEACLAFLVQDERKRREAAQLAISLFGFWCDTGRYRQGLKWVKGRSLLKKRIQPSCCHSNMS